MTIFLAPRIEKNEIITNIVDILTQADNQTQLFDRSRNSHKA